MLIFQASTQSPLLTTGSTRALQLGNVQTMGHSYNGKPLSRKEEDPLPPASCRLRDSSAQPDKWERPRLGDPTLSVHFTAFWRRPDQRAGEQAGGCLGLRDGYCGGDEVLFRVWSDGTLHPCQKVQKCALKKKKINFTMYMFNLNTHKQMPKE